MSFSMEPQDFVINPDQDGGEAKKKNRTSHFQLYDRETDEAVPLKQVGFNIDICQGFADFVMHQLYENSSENPLEVQFMMPASETFTLSQIAMDVTLPNGETRSTVTRVTEREKAQQVYEDKIAAGQTAVIATLPRLNSRS